MLLNGVINYIKEIPKHRIRLCIGIIYILSVGGLSFFLVGSDNLKSLMVCIFWGIIGGAMIILPRKELPLKADLVIHGIMLAVYGIYVPKKLFDRTELPVHDLSGMFPDIWKINILLIIIYFFFMLFLLQRTSYAFVATGVTGLLLTVINYYVNCFRGTTLTVSDLIAFRTGMIVMGNYTYKISPELWKTVVYFLAFILIGSRIDVKIKGWKYHVGVSLFAIVGLMCSMFAYTHSSVRDLFGAKAEYGNLLAGQQGYGLYYYIVLSYYAGYMERPAGYTDGLLSQIARETEENYSVTVSDQKPDIILIMNEAWADLRVLGDLETTAPFSPFFDSMEQNTVKGNTHVNILGGMTCNSEFEALTGDSMTFLDLSATPYQTMIKHPIASLATVLKDQGYNTFAMTPSVGVSWNRTKVFDYMGFDHFITVDDFSVDFSYVGNFASDDCVVDELIYLYENRDISMPFFAFNITIQNHSGYSGQTEITVKTSQIGNSDIALGDVNTYLSLLKLSDSAFQKLIEYFAGVDRPVIVCMFGDHQPILQPAFYDAIFEDRGLTPEEQERLQYITPYVIWTNYDSDIREYGDISASMLGAILCETAHLDMPVYYQFLLSLHDEIPYLNMYNYDLYADNPLVNKWKCLQYNHLTKEDYRQDIFAVK